MAKSKAKKEKALSPKKEMRNQVTNQLKNALNGLEDKLGRKEFESRIKKAAKLLTTGIRTKQAKLSKNKAAETNISSVQ